MSAALRPFALPFACLWICQGTSAAGEPLPRGQLVKQGKAATALVEMKPRYGSAFCVHPSGLFVTNEHVVRPFGIPAPVTLVLDAGMKTQKVLRATVVRRDPALDLALLRAEGKHELAALALGSDQDLDELSELVAFGFPFGLALAKPGVYPSITVTTGRVTSLRREQGELSRIQLDASLNPGNSGGPVLDRGGKMVGVVVGGIVGAGLNLAIPVRHLKRFLARPEIVFTPPAVSRANASQPVTFRARVLSPMPSASPREVELVLSSGLGKYRRYPMKLTDGSYLAEAVPFPRPAGPAAVPLTVKYDNGSVSGTAEDRSFRVGQETIKLSQVRSLRPGPKAAVELSDGRAVAGGLSGLDVLPVAVGKQSLQLDLAGAVELHAEPPDDVTGLY